MCTWGPTPPQWVVFSSVTRVAQNHKHCWDRRTSFGSRWMHTSCHWEMHSYWADTSRQQICCSVAPLYPGNGKSTRRWFKYRWNYLWSICKQTTQCGARQDRGRGFGPGFVGVRLAKLRAEYHPTSVSVMDDTVPHSTDCATSVADSHILAEHGSTCCWCYGYCSAHYPSDQTYCTRLAWDCGTGFPSFLFLKGTV